MSSPRLDRESAVAKSAPRWSRLDSDNRRAQILREARRLFHKRTYSAVSTDDIARAVGVTRGLVHHYFGTKRKLFLAVVRDSLDNVPHLQLSRRGRASLQHAVDRGVTLWLDAIEADPEMFLAVFGAEGFGRDHEMETIVSEGREQTVDAMIAALGISEGTGQIRAAIRSYYGLVEAATREWVERRTLDRTEVHGLLSVTLVAIIRRMTSK